MVVTISIFYPILYVADQVCFGRSFWQILLFVYAIPSFVLGFVFFAFSRLIFKKCKLVASDVAVKSQSLGERLQGENLSDFSYDSEDEQQREQNTNELAASQQQQMDNTVTKSEDEDDSICVSRPFE